MSPVDLRQKLPTNIYLLRVNNRNTRQRCEIHSKLTRTCEHITFFGFACNAKSFAMAFVVFLSFLLHPFSTWTDKNYQCIFLLFLLQVRMADIGLTNVICRVFSSHALQRQTVMIDLDEGMWNLGFQPLKHYISTSTMPMDTKLGTVVTYHEESSAINSHSSLITWSWEIT